MGRDYQPKERQKLQLERKTKRRNAVFDRDDHERYHDALKKAEALNGKLKNDAKQKITFKAIASVPSFELWLLLHYEDIQAPLHRDEVMSRLRQHLPRYSKGEEGIFGITRNNVDIAISRAGVLAQRFTAYADPQPFTGIVELVEFLTKLKK